jgi:signal transduction histidine kinase
MGLLNIAEAKPANIDDIHAMMRRSVMKLDETLKEIIDYSNNARSEITSSEIDWKNQINLAMGKLLYLANASKVQLVIDDSGAKFPFYSDPGRLAIIFNSLFSNCITYCASDKIPTIHTKIDVAYDTVAITVTDNGIGINENCLPHVFNMFYRGSDRSSGAGLGLYITKETVKKLGGHVTIQSIEGRSTMVTVTLPNNHRDSSVNEGDGPFVE